MRPTRKGFWRIIPAWRGNCGRWLLLATLILTVLLAAIQMGVDLSRKPPEEHYSWFGWWMIFAMGAYFVGGGLVLGHVFGPSVAWLWQRFRKSRSGTDICRTA